MEGKDDAEIPLQSLEETHPRAVVEKSDRAALVDIWHPDRIDPPQLTVKKIHTFASELAQYTRQCNKLQRSSEE
ncbi:hypothetical protein HGM15179_012069 [Zosterops borbonicus]|uniref:Uncharacterized protein n=1 Tax=Zosterops borbonicus TaxID=364589 RepID=A0A8K1LIB6_9PASS|nr:hypothetical protein HGM15179_012069 [Zosterops borbonicus]